MVLMLAACSRVPSSGITVEDAWSPAAPPGAGALAVYAQIVPAQDDTLLRVSSSAAANAELHATLEQDGVMQMRPKSPILAALEADRDPWGAVEVHTMWTPYDLMIVPPHSSQLPGVASDHRLNIALHRWMITHPRAIERVCAILDCSGADT